MSRSGMPPAPPEVGLSPGVDVRQFLDCMVDGFLALDHASRFIYVNHSAAVILRRSPEELIDRHVWSVFPEALGTPFQNRYEEAIATGVPCSFEEYYPPNGEWYEVNIYPSENGAYVVVRDVTTRHQEQEALRESREQIERQLNEIESIYRSAHVGLCVLDRELRYVRINDRLAELNGLPAAAHIGRTVGEVLPNLANFADEVSRRIFATGEPVLDLQLNAYTHAQPDTERIWVEQWLPLKNAAGEVIGINVAVEEVTQRKRAEEVLRRSRDELDALVRQRTAELHRLADRLRKLTLELTQAEDRERRRLATVLHDHLQQLLVGAKLNLASLISRRMTVEELKAALTTLQDIVDQSLAASRSLTAELAPPVLYQAGLRRGFEWLKKWMADKHKLELILDCEDQPDTLTDDMRILAFQATRELLFNVVKHANVKQATVKMQASADGKVSITVSDRGMGFDNAMPEQAGEGFGLFSIRERVKTVGGDVDIRSAPGQGTEVRLTLPGARRGGSSVKGAGADSEFEGIRVLLVDDHGIVREGLTKILAECDGVQVVGEAEDGLQAVDLAERLRPDVVVIDVALPRLDGIEATRRIKAHHPEMRVIGLSMHTRDEKEAAMLAAGAEAYLDKARASELLVAAIRANSAVGVR